MNVRIAPLPGEAPPIPDAGLGALTTERGNLPLDAVDVHAAVTGLVARIEVSQGFRNPFDVPLEATYVFPLPDRAAVTRMRMEAADRVVEGTLKERGQARADYDAAVAAGQRAAIAEEDRPDVFTMRVGNILPGERVTIRMTLDQPLPYEDDAATFRFPLVVAPRYIPGEPLPGEQAGDGTAADTDAVPDASRISPPVLLPGFPNPVRLSLTVDIDPGGLPLGEIRSSLHVVARDGDDSGHTTVRLHPGERLDRDFILRLAYPRPETTAAALTLTPDKEGGSGTFALTVLPPSGRGASRPRDVVLLLDRSGSMGGWKMVAARRAAARIVDTLTDRDRFAVLSFDHEVAWPPSLGSGLSPASDRNRFRAVEHLAGLQARGGTEMLAPLQQGTALLNGDDAAGRDRVLVLITDGQVGNEDHILARVQPSLAGLRVHTVGIDRAVNSGFLGRLALVGQGRFELVESEDRLDEAMEHIHHRINAPLLTGLSLDWSGVEVEPGTLAPHRLGALFPGVPLVVAGRYRRADDGCSVSVRAISSDGTPWRHEATASVADQTGAATAIWARAHLRDLEDQYAVNGLPNLERQIVDTSLRFNVLCRFTAFVAVDSRVVAEGGPAHQVVQPIEQPSGWQMPAPVAPMSMPMAASPPPGAAPPTATGGYGMPTPAGPLPTGTLAAESLDSAMPSPRQRRGARSRPGAAPAAPAAPAVPAAPSAPEPVGGAASPGLPTVRTLLQQELDRLEALAAAPGPERWRHLSDLRTRLLGLTEAVRREGLPADRLTALAEALEVTDDPSQQSRLDELWSLTVRELTALTTGTGRPAPQGRRSFWKRRP
ncbi:Ca-activated chloride channel family protein [Thermomonospora echinospora]|uniref:Ca-activated chloride channel family protein n=1 Tax=Thermomonospora echinospora TaxID=1992 RepID=A0A1H5YUZ1_9ACTN|nr:VIT domain-containing protein [Thermomonospora echinospora]SEG27552.1 Ca-activated chloride channel family protein [Thermomonospora echinospora]